MVTGKTPGTLYLVATPIGNLEDITLRALRILKEVDLIAAEDTRHSRKLLTHYGISQTLVSCYEHNEARRIPGIIEALQAGKSVALISDAGSPGISDPGFRLVKEAAEQNIQVSAIPGPSSAIMALSLSGLPTDRFTFFGFLPRTRPARRKFLEEIATMDHTLLFFESPHRMLASLTQMVETLGDRQAALCREMTKRFEQIERGPLSSLVEKLGEKKIKGECCLVVHGCASSKAGDPPEEIDPRFLEEELAQARARGEPIKTVTQRLALKYNLSRRSLYQMALKLDPP